MRFFITKWHQPCWLLDVLAAGVFWATGCTTRLLVKLTPEGIVLSVHSQSRFVLQEETPACGLQQWATCLVTTAVFDVRWNSRFGAALNLFRSLFVIVALGCGAVLFNNDSNRLVLRPIERMLRKV